MGCCSLKPKINKVLDKKETDLNYPRTTTVQIKNKSLRGRVTSVETVTFNHTEPMICVSEEISINFLTWASGIH